MFIYGRCGKFAEQPGGKKAAAAWRNVAAGDSPQNPQEPPELQSTAGRNSYLQSIRTGGFAMTGKREKSILTSPPSASEYEAAVAAFIQNRGITRCPTVCLARTQATVPAADRMALEQYESGREQSRRSHVATTARLLGVFVPPSSPC